MNHPHVECCKSKWSRHLRVVNQEDVEKVMKIQDLPEFVNELEIVKVFVADLGLLIVWRMFVFCRLLFKNRTIRVLAFLRLLA